jgi:hypothetical protein
MSYLTFGLWLLGAIVVGLAVRRLGRIADALEAGNRNLDAVDRHIDSTNKDLARIAGVFESVHKDWKEDMEKELG